MIDSKRKLKKEKNKKQIYSESIQVYHMIQWVFFPVSLKVASFYTKIFTVKVILSAFMLGSAVKSGLTP